MTTSTQARNFGLKQEEFDQLRMQLMHGDETLFQTIFFAHFDSCMHYLKKHYSLSHEKAYDLTMDTLLVFRRKLLEGKIKYGNLRFLFTQMASHTFLKEVERAPSKSLKKEVQVLLNEPSVQLDQEELQLLGRAWSKLGEKCKALLTRVYYNNEQLKDIAIEHNQSPATLRKQKQRCVEKLRSFFEINHLS